MSQWTGAALCTRGNTNTNTTKTNHFKKSRMKGVCRMGK
nr:MAG TPA: hypothetical protein [Caudoviricetes sp.]